MKKNAVNKEHQQEYAAFTSPNYSFESSFMFLLHSKKSRFKKRGIFDSKIMQILCK
jgi:hypothetical protein